MRSKLTKVFLFSTLIFCFSFSVLALEVKVGAYYFDGWTGKTKHISQKLMSFSERKPIWGWVTSTQSVVESQIDLASNFGIDFFNFCWYFDHKGDNSSNLSDKDPKNNAMQLFLKAGNSAKMEFCITVANHNGYDIDASDWPNLVKYWVSLFKNKSYLKVDNKPYITFFDFERLVQTFGNEEQLTKALKYLKDYAVSQGLSGVSIAICSSPSSDRISRIEKVGFDVITYYNRHEQGMLNRFGNIYPMKDLQNGDIKALNNYKRLTMLPIVPTVTLGWDKRPQEYKDTKNISSRFDGYSQISVKASVLGVKNWIRNNRGKVLGSVPIMNIYAWNEYAEGAWLTPSEKFGNSLLEGLKEGLN